MSDYAADIDKAGKEAHTSYLSQLALAEEAAHRREEAKKNDAYQTLEQKMMNW